MSVLNMPLMTRLGLEPPTLIGMSAVVMWSATVGLYRSIFEIFGALGGSALIFTVSAVVAALHGGRAAFRGHSPRYLLIGGGLFVAYEMALALGVGFATTRMQSVEVGLINYLWPCFVIALAVAMGQARADWRLVPGVLISLAGVVWASAGGEGFSLAGFVANLQSAPLAYVLGLVAALTWPVYTVLTRSMSGGRNAVPPFLAMTALVLWGIWAVSDAPPLAFDLQGAVLLLTLGTMVTLAYSAWTHGVNHGSLTLMATASYFTPILSVLFSAVLLNMTLSPAFWLGAGMVTLGSLVCWRATRGGAVA